MSESDPDKLKSYTDLWLVTDKQSKTVVLSWSCKIGWIYLSVHIMQS